MDLSFINMPVPGYRDRYVQVNDQYSLTLRRRRIHIGQYSLSFSSIFNDMMTLTFFFFKHWSKGSLQIYKLRISSLEMAEGTLSSSDDCIGVSMVESGGYMEHTNYRRR